MSRRLVAGHRPHPRGASRRLVAGALALGALVAPPVATAQSPADARLQGAFQLAGRVKTAVNVRGERRGQTITRVWTFTPQCASGPCATVLLTRPRAGGTDTVTLTQRSPGHYAGSAQFYVPLRCAGRLYPRGELVPFRVAVAVTTAIGSPPRTPTARGPT